MEFVEVFANRRKEFLLALSIHSTVGVGEANFKLGIIDRTTAEINQRRVPRMPVVHLTADTLS